MTSRTSGANPGRLVWPGRWIGIGIDMDRAPGIGDEAHFLIKRQGARVIEVVCIDPNARGVLFPTVANNPVKQIAAEPQSDVLGKQSEIGEMNNALLAPIELCVTGRATGSVQHIDLDKFVLDGFAKLSIAHSLTIRP